MRVKHVNMSCSGIFLNDGYQCFQTGGSYEFRPLVWSRLEQKFKFVQQEIPCGTSSLLTLGSQVDSLSYLHPIFTLCHLTHL